jgi:hypothetical protein
MYVGGRPAFDGCMKAICLSSNPQAYQVAYTSSFDTYPAMKEKYERFVQTYDGIETDFLKKIDRTLATTHQADTWQLGTGGYYDPCLERSASANAYILYALFAVSIIAITADFAIRGMWMDWHGEFLACGWCCGAGCLECVVALNSEGPMVSCLNASLLNCPAALLPCCPAAQLP